MIHLLPLLRFPRWLRRSRTAPTTVPTPSLTPEPSKETPAPPAWHHGPPTPRDRAEQCGQCGEDIPAASVDGEFCNSLCASRWITVTMPRTDPNTDLFIPPDISPQPPPEPAWMAQISAWERAKARNVIKARKSPGSEAA